MAGPHLSRPRGHWELRPDAEDLRPRLVRHVQPDLVVPRRSEPGQLLLGAVHKLARLMEVNVFHCF